MKSVLVISADFYFRHAVAGFSFLKVMAESPRIQREIVDNDDSDWEYEYHETETEVRFPQLHAQRKVSQEIELLCDP